MKKNFKKIISVLIVATLLATCLSGCKNTISDKADDKISIVCTTFPQYDWIRQIIGEDNETFELSLIISNGVDLHSYQPTTADFATIRSADLFVYIGGSSAKWIDDSVDNENVNSLDLMQLLSEDLVEEEIVEGMQSEEDEHEHGEDGEDERGQNAVDDSSAEYDEHIWLSLKNAKKLVSLLCDEICKLDEKNSSVYEKNANDYILKLDELDEQYESTVMDAKYDTVIFGDRFPFRYMFEDYNINYYAAFVGCSAETEASFETIVFLANKLDELGMKNIIIIDNSKDSLARTIIDSTKNKDQNILTLNSLQTITTEDLDSGVSYLDVMRDNLNILDIALNN